MSIAPRKGRMPTYGGSRRGPSSGEQYCSHRTRAAVDPFPTTPIEPQRASWGDLCGWNGGEVASPRQRLSFTHFSLIDD
jgi:hypothetical protein